MHDSRLGSMKRFAAAVALCCLAVGGSALAQTGSGSGGEPPSGDPLRAERAGVGSSFCRSLAVLAYVGCSGSETWNALPGKVQGSADTRSKRMPGASSPDRIDTRDNAKR